MPDLPKENKDRNIFMFKLICFCIMALVLTGCTSAKTAKQALHALGFTDIHITGYRLFGCEEDNIFHTGFSARSAQGKIVTGTVCSGIIMGGHVRFD